MLLVAAAMAGLANSVYHPADYAVLGSDISEGRVGRAFSLHTALRVFGGAIAPAFMLGVAASGGMSSGDDCRRPGWPAGGDTADFRRAARCGQTPPGSRPRSAHPKQAALRRADPARDGDDGILHHAGTGQWRHS
jgi:hypothetical protein